MRLLSESGRAATIALLLLIACDDDRASSGVAGPSLEKPAPAERTPPIAASVRPLTPYPRGPWRLAPFDELGRTLLWFSHILVRHAEVAPDDFDDRFRAAWDPNGTPPARSRDEALQLAQRLSAKLTKEPNAFAAVARAYSEDRATAALGGSLGGTRASQLGPAFLDALAALRPGQISEVIESGHGFHILLLQEPPADSQIAGRRLVIRYRGTIDSLGQGDSARTREQALALAQNLRAQDTDLGTVIAAHSEHADRLRGGDIGLWSTRAPLHNGLELETLAALAEGAISEPLDSQYGFLLLQRTPSTPRPLLGATTLSLPYDAETKASAEKQAQSLLRRLHGGSRPFAADDAAGFTSAVEQWTHGRGDPFVETAIADLDVDEIAPRVIDTGRALVLVRRVEAAPAVTEELRYALPTTNSPNMEAILRHSTSEALALQISGLKAAIAQTLALVPEQQTIVDRVLDRLASDFRSMESAEERRAARDAARATLRRELDATSYARTDDFIRAWVRQQVMDDPTVNVN